MKNMSIRQSLQSGGTGCTDDMNSVGVCDRQLIGTSDSIYENNVSSRVCLLLYLETLSINVFL